MPVVFDNAPAAPKIDQPPKSTGKVVFDSTAPQSKNVVPDSKVVFDSPTSGGEEAYKKSFQLTPEQQSEIEISDQTGTPVSKPTFLAQQRQKEARPLTEKATDLAGQVWSGIKGVAGIAKDAVESTGEELGKASVYPGASAAKVLKEIPGMDLAAKGIELISEKPPTKEQEVSSPSQTIVSGIEKGGAYIGDIVQRVGAGTYVAALDQANKAMGNPIPQETIDSLKYDRYLTNNMVQDFIANQLQKGTPEANKAVADAASLVVGPGQVVKSFLPKAVEAGAEKVAAKIPSIKASAERAGAPPLPNVAPVVEEIPSAANISKNIVRQEAAETTGLDLAKEAQIRNEMLGIKPPTSAVSKIISGISKVSETVGEKAESVQGALADVATWPLKKLGFSNVAEKVSNVLAGRESWSELGAIGGAAMLGHLIPNAITTPAAIVAAWAKASKAVTDTMKNVGQAGRIVSETLDNGPLVEKSVPLQIAQNAEAPMWLRRAAVMAETSNQADKIIGVGKAVNATGGALKAGAKGGLTLGILMAPDDPDAAANAGGMAFGMGPFFAPEIAAHQKAVRDARLVQTAQAAFVDHMIKTGAPREILEKVGPDAAFKLGVLLNNVPGIDPRFVSAKRFQEMNMDPDKAGAAFIVGKRDPATGKIPLIINVEAPATAMNAYHEYGHAMFDAMPENRTGIIVKLQNVYGQEGIDAKKLEYATALARNRAKNQSRFGSAEPTPEQIRAELENLDRSDPDWIYKEIYAETVGNHLMTSPIQSIMRGAKISKPTDITLDPENSSLVQSSLGQGARILQGLGIRMDPNGSGYPVAKEANLFSALKQDPELLNMVRQHMKLLNEFVDLDRSEKTAEKMDKGVALDPRLIGKHESAPVFYNPTTKLNENDAGYMTSTGKFVPWTKRQFNDREKFRTEEVVNKLENLPRLNRDDPRLGWKTDALGRMYIGGSTVPEWIYGLSSINENAKAYLKQVEEAINTGDVFNLWYQSVIKGPQTISGLAVSNRDFKPISIRISAPGEKTLSASRERAKTGGNIFVNALDVTAARARAENWARSEHPALKELWNGDLNAFWTDLYTLFQNHRQGKPGDTGIGADKRNVLYDFLGTRNLEAGDRNPDREYPVEKAPLVKSFRIDRMQGMKPTGENRWFFDYGKNVNKMRPETAQTDTPEFKKWFGASRVVSKDGSPLVVYHGTEEKKPIGKFKTPAYFAETPEFADIFANKTGKNQGSVYPAFVSLKKPYVINGDREGMHFEWDAADVARMKKEGYDGVIVKSRGKSNIYTAFDPEQIKSATGNSGAFDPNNPNISMRPQIDFTEASKQDVQGKGVKGMKYDDTVVDVKSMPQGKFLVGPKFFDRNAEERAALIDAARKERMSVSANPEAVPLKIIRDKDGAISLDKNGEAKFSTNAYGIRTAPDVKALKVEDAKDSYIADKIVNEYNSAAKGNPDVMNAVGWYSRAKEKIQKIFGANIELVGQLLGASSANTPVETNVAYTLDALKKYSSGQLNSLMEKYHQHIMEVKRAANDGATLRRVWENRFPQRNPDNYTPEDAYRQLINDFKYDAEKEFGTRYGMNTDRVIKALYGNWLETTKGPKTPNFAGNFTGRTREATIDVWAARMLRRLLYSEKNKQWRILPEAEAGVSDSDFMTAQRSFRKAADKLGISPDDLQAIMWFHEKDVWDKSGWSKGAGAEKSDAVTELETQLPETKRFQLGVTTFQQKGIPADFKNQLREFKVFMEEQPGILALRVTPSEGMYQGGREPSFDVEFTVDAKTDITPVVNRMIDLGKQWKQNDVMVSEVVDNNHPNRRPGVEVGFKTPAKREQMVKIMEVLNSHGIYGMSVARDSRGRIIGFRSQFVPEFAEILDAQKAQEAAQEWGKNVRKALAEIPQDDVSYSYETSFATTVFRTSAGESLAGDYGRSSQGDVAAQLGRRKEILSFKPEPDARNIRIPSEENVAATH